MPIYEYRCEACGAKEEKIQTISAPEQHVCPQCEAEGGMRRQISRTGFMLSGGGWYAQGYGPGGEGGAKASGSGSMPEPAAAEAKPDGAGCASGCACHSPKVQKALENG